MYTCLLESWGAAGDGGFQVDGSPEVSTDESEVEMREQIRARYGAGVI
jgi:hypothetical protein